jgi:exodeoxyribonuclease-3
MKVLSWNVNGLRSVYNHGFSDWLETVDADVICVQEIKAQADQIPRGLFANCSYELHLNCAGKKGYSGVAVYSKQRPLRIVPTLGFERFDNEGRMLRLEYPDFILVCLYMPHGGRLKENLLYKFDAYKYVLEYAEKLQDSNVILAGDFNIAHQDIDLARPKQNRSNVMFTSEERSLIDSLLMLGFTDSFRRFHKEGNYYTWWPYMANARKRNLGWRIDYIFTSRSLTPLLKNAFILSDVPGSDHCPVGLEF